ncbi:MAG: tyrosine-type recombinase/integrase, partial [Candidatus Dadabacteria bacterium]|nr:tyrosine-type recombinase/integrase [Candidatus Dadabacteria bacterium]NIQ16221.1 tyrosine-type recombinase/integrase [Candidatus Dadabacteria bacterium]
MGTVFKRGKNWVIEYNTRSGKSKRESIGKIGIITKTMAKEVLKTREQQIKLGKYEMIEAIIPTVKEYSYEYLDYQENVKQIRSYPRTRACIGHLVRYYGTKMQSDVTSEDIDVYKRRRLSEGVKQNTIARELVFVRNFFYHAESRNKFFGKNPVKQSGIPQVNDKKERVLTVVEEKRLMDSCPDYLKHAILIALNTGMRRGEILRLKWEWIDFDENLIVLPQTNTKNKESRKIPINHLVRKILLERKLISGNSVHVFASIDSKSGHIYWLNRSFKRACKIADIEGLRFHDLRHTAATRLVESNIPLHEVAKLLGHSTIKITERYSHPEE